MIDDYKNDDKILTELPRIADEFRGIRIQGLVIRVRKDGTGLIACCPYQHQPKQYLTIEFYMTDLTENDRGRLSANMSVEFSIGVNTLNKYVCMDIIIVEHGFINKFIPVTIKQINRKCKGKIVVPPTSVDKYKGYGFIYNEMCHNMCRLEITRQEMIHDFPVGMYVRYNERIDIIKDMNNEQRDEYNINASDIITVQKIDIEKK
eukprot:45115_1